MMNDFLPFFARIIIFVIIVRIIVGAVSDHNRHTSTRTHVGCCQTATVYAVKAVNPVQASVPATVVAPVTNVTKSSVVPVASVGEARFCSSCGAQRAPNASFCTTCGSELS